MALASTQDKAIATVDVKKPAGDMKNLNALFSQRKNALQQASASHINADRVAKIAIRCVSMTPKLRECTCESVFRSVLQAAELGLEPGSALGTAYLVPYGQECTLIVGYRGLVALAYRSGQVKTVRAREVYEGETFNYRTGLTQVLEHTPSGDTLNPEKITHAYCVIELKDGGVICDVMTRGEIERIRRRSKASGSGPWVTDYAEMCKKTVTRRALKYAPMSVEMSKAFAADAASDSGDMASLAEFESIDVVEESEPAHGNAAVAGKIAGKGKGAPTVAELTQDLGLSDDKYREIGDRLSQIEGAGTTHDFLAGCAAGGDKNSSDVEKRLAAMEGQRELV